MARFHFDIGYHSNSDAGRLTGAVIFSVILWFAGSIAHAEEAEATISGSATFGAWELYCGDDAANSLRRCHIAQGDILVVGIRGLDGTEVAAVQVSGDPPMLGKSVTYQVDAEPALSWLPDGDNEGESAVIIQQMLHGQQIEARYLSFEGDPLEFKLDQAGRTAHATLAGFAAAHAEMQKRLAAYQGD
jgi:hypothetical protein